jgi:hypothetical protein
MPELGGGSKRFMPESSLGIAHIPEEKTEDKRVIEFLVAIEFRD